MPAKQPLHIVEAFSASHPTSEEAGGAQGAQRGHSRKTPTDQMDILYPMAPRSAINPGGRLLWEAAAQATVSWW